jgi:hypothetical protein
MSAKPLVICTIEPQYAQVIGACMQFISLQETNPAPDYLLRIIDGEKAENAPIAALARVAAIPTRSTERHAANRFLNKWHQLPELLQDISGPVLLLDWDVLNSKQTQLPNCPSDKISARLNPRRFFSNMPEGVVSIGPQFWEGTDLPCSINSGVVIGPAELIAKAAHRVLELGPLIAQLAPESPDWQREKLAASIAFGELGLTPLGEEWNVTAFSGIPDAQVRFWHFHSGHDVTRKMKQSLHRPAELRVIVQGLSPRWTRQQEVFLGLYEAALQKLRLDDLLEPDAAELKRRADSPKEPWRPRKKFLLVACSSGLCNRLLVLAGAQRLARMTGRELFLYWPINHELGCGFQDLFCNDIRILQEKDLHYLFNTGVTLRVYNAWHTLPPHFSDLSPDGDPDAEVVILKAFYYPKFRHEAYDSAFFEAVRPELLSFKVQEPIVQSLSEFSLPPRTIGVHLRRCDPLPEFERSRDEDFERIMAAIIREIPDVRFFLATDHAATEEKFLRSFGARTIRQKKEWSGRQSGEGIKEGLKDLLLLSRSRAVLGTNHSSFSYTASALGGIPLLTADVTSASRQITSTIASLTKALEAPAS